MLFSTTTVEASKRLLVAPDSGFSEAARARVRERCVCRRVVKTTAKQTWTAVSREEMDEGYLRSVRADQVVAFILRGADIGLGIRSLGCCNFLLVVPR